MKTSPTAGKSAAGLTASQIIILQHAAGGPIRMMAGDRLGTRCAGYDTRSGAARIVAYSNPEVSLLRRGLLRRGAAAHHYEITAEGRGALARAEAVIAKR